MADTDWSATFETIFLNAVQQYRKTGGNAASLFSTRDQTFLAKIGHTAQELFDFVEDHCDDGAPDFETTLAVAAIRRRYFIEVQHRIPSQFHGDPQELPAKTDALEGFRWLPRIIAKARAKLRGELDASIMYGCGGDREFVESIGMTLPQFLQLVWDSGEDDAAIVAAVKESIVTPH